MVLLPLPLSPTSAVTCPAGTCSEKCENTGTSGRVGYANVTSLSSTAPATAPSGLWPSSTLASISDLRSITAWRCKVSVCGQRQWGPGRFSSAAVSSPAAAAGRVPRNTRCTALEPLLMSGNAICAWLMPMVASRMEKKTLSVSSRFISSFSTSLPPYQNASA
jgi:hypothetical protein